MRSWRRHSWQLRADFDEEAIRVTDIADDLAPRLRFGGFDSGSTGRQGLAECGINVLGDHSQLTRRSGLLCAGGSDLDRQHLANERVRREGQARRPAFE